MNRESPNLPLEHPTPPRFKYTYFHQRPPYYNPSSEATKTPIEYSAHLFNNGRIDQETQVSNFPSPKKQKENSPKDFTSEIYKGVKQNNINKGNTNKRRGKSLERPRGYNPNNEYKSLGAIYGSIRGGSKMQGMNRPNPRSNENTNPHGSRRFHIYIYIYISNIGETNCPYMTREHISINLNPKWKVKKERRNLRNRKK